MVIVEGCDNTGKTTLIEKLMADFPILVRAPKSPGPAPGDEQWDFMMGYLSKPPKETTPIIFDRFPLISEPVYGVAVRDGSALDGDKIKLGTKLLRKHQPLIIYAERSKEDILKTFHEREQLEGVEDKINIILTLYEFELAFYPDCTIRYDYGKGGDYLKIKQCVANYLRRRIHNEH
jgi:hypothetical protein